MTVECTIDIQSHFLLLVCYKREKGRSAKITKRKCTPLREDRIGAVCGRKTRRRSVAAAMKTDSMDERARKDERFHSKINHFFAGLGTDLPPMPVCSLVR